IVLATMSFILLCQLPNLANLYQPWNRPRPDDPNAQLIQQKWDLAQSLAEGKITPAEHQRRVAELDRAHQERSQQREQRLLARLPAGAAPVKVAPAPPSARTPGLLDRRLPWLSEQASAVALASFTSLLRAPEAKMLLLGPIIMAVVFGGLLLTRTAGMPDEVR